MPKLIGYRYHVVVDIRVENDVEREVVHDQIEEALHTAAVTGRACWDPRPISVKSFPQKES